MMLVTSGTRTVLTARMGYLARQGCGLTGRSHEEE